MKNKKIFFVTITLSGGGAERVMSVLADYFVKKGYEVAFIVLKKADAVYTLNPDVKCYYMTEQGEGKITEQIKFIRKYMKENIGSVFVSFFTHQNLYTILASIGLKVKVVVSERNDPEKSIHGKFKKLARLVMYSLKSCTKIVFQTEGARDYFPMQIRNKGRIIPNPLKENLPMPYERERKKEIVSFGRLEPQKNYALLINAFKKISDEYSEYKLVLYGQGSLEDKLRNMVSDLGLSDKVVFAGFSKNVHELIKDAAMFVLPSDYEGLSNSMLEAMAIGLPTICTDCPPGGARMFITPKENGLLTKVGDVETMYNAIKYMIENPEHANEMGMEASKVKEELAQEKVCKEWEETLV